MALGKNDKDFHPHIFYFFVLINVSFFREKIPLQLDNTLEAGLCFAATHCFPSMEPTHIFPASFFTYRSDLVAALNGKASAGLS